jgi:acyl-CoA synthetase (NDP forming)
VDKNRAQKIVDGLKNENRNHLSEPESYEVLGAYGLRSIGSFIAKSLDETLLAAKEMGYPVVLKIVSSEIMHKIDVGAVKINLKNEDDLKNAFQEIEKSVKRKKPNAVIQGFLVQKYFTEKGMETIVGVKAIKGFGHLIMFGSGGTFVELFKDVAFRLAPLTKQDALNMIMETKGYQILKGFRGQPSYDLNAIIEYLLRISQLVTDFPAIQELDMNPIKVLETGKGAIVMDAKMVLEEQITSMPEGKEKLKEDKMNIV